MNVQTILQINLLVIFIYAIIYWLLDYYYHMKYTTPAEALYYSVSCHMPFTPNDYQEKSMPARIVKFSHNTIVHCLSLYRLMY